MFRFALLSSFLFLSACAQQSATEYAQVEGQRLALSAEMTPGVIDAEFILRINGQMVIKDKTVPFGGSSQTFNGQHQGRPVSARATRVQKWASTYTLVDVFYNGQLIDSLTI